MRPLVRDYGTQLNLVTEYNGASGSRRWCTKWHISRDYGYNKRWYGQNYTVVTQGDVDTAKKSINDEIDEATAKQQLSKEFGDSYTVIADSFKVDTSDITSSVAVGSEASGGKAALEGDAKYSLYAVSDDDLNKYLDAVITQQIDKADEQKIYSNGLDKATFGDVSSVKDGISASLSSKW